jgi:hypothetical protein
MKKPKIKKSDDMENALNTNEVMRDYEFYLKMYFEHQKMDFENDERIAS